MIPKPENCVVTEMAVQKQHFLRHYHAFLQLPYSVCRGQIFTSIQLHGQYIEVSDHLSQLIDKLEYSMCVSVKGVSMIYMVRNVQVSLMRGKIEKKHKEYIYQ